MHAYIQAYSQSNCYRKKFILRNDSRGWLGYNYRKTLILVFAVPLVKLYLTFQPNIVLISGVSFVCPPPLRVFVLFFNHYMPSCCWTIVSIVIIFGIGIRHIIFYFPSDVIYQARNRHCLCAAMNIFIYWFPHLQRHALSWGTAAQYVHLGHFLPGRFCQGLPLQVGNLGFPCLHLSHRIRPLTAQ